MFWNKSKEEKITGLKLECDGSAKKEFYKKVANARRIDESFSLITDTSLTDEEKLAIDKYWGKYSFAYPEIDYKSFKTFKNRYGKFDVRHCPGAIRTQYFSKHFVNKTYTMAFQNKGLLDHFYPNVRMPVIVVRRLNTEFFDKDFNIINLDTAIKIMLEKAHSGTRVIIKLSGSGGGKGIFFVDKDSTYDSLKKDIQSFGVTAFVAQEVMEQSDFMKQFNSDAVNTIRITSLFYKSQIYIIGVLIRIGKPGNSVDNYSQGGSLLGVNKETGVCNNWALTHEHKRLNVLPSGFVLDDKEIVIPNFDIIKETIKRLHTYNPYIRMVSWDIALDKENMPVLIEANHGGMHQIHEAVTGPLFGDLMDELLDDYLLKRFCIPFTVGDWTCDEYHDHVAIVKYNGNEKSVIIPNEINGKKVTFISPKVFEDKTIIKLISTKEIIDIIPKTVSKLIVRETIEE